MTTVLKLVPLLGVICLGLWVLLTDPAAYTQHVPPNPTIFSALSTTTTLTLFAMLGIECAMIPAGRVRDPSRTIPRATLIGTLVTAAIYIGVSAVPMLLIPQAALAASNAPFADLFAQVLGNRSGQVLAIFVVIGGMGALNGWTLVLGEVTQTMARHGSFPRFLSKENRHGAPTFALIATGSIASVMLLMNYNQSVAGMFAFLNIVVTAGNLPFYFVCALAVLLGAHRFPGMSPLRARLVKAAASGRSCFAHGRHSASRRSRSCGPGPARGGLLFMGWAVFRPHVLGRFLSTPTPIADPRFRVILKAHRFVSPWICSRPAHACPAPGAGTNACKLAEQLVEMGLIGQATVRGNLTERGAGRQHQPLRALHPAADHVAVGRIAKTVAEGAAEVKRAQACDLGQTPRRDGVVEICLHVGCQLADLPGGESPAHLGVGQRLSGSMLVEKRMIGGVEEIGDHG